MGVCLVDRLHSVPEPRCHRHNIHPCGQPGRRGSVPQGMHALIARRASFLAFFAPRSNPSFLLSRPPVGFPESCSVHRTPVRPCNDEGEGNRITVRRPPRQCHRARSGCVDHFEQKRLRLQQELGGLVQGFVILQRPGARGSPHCTTPHAHLTVKGYVEFFDISKAKPSSEGGPVLEIEGAKWAAAIVRPSPPAGKSLDDPWALCYFRQNCMMV